MEEQLWAGRRQEDPAGHYWKVMEGGTGEVPGSLGGLQSQQRLLGGTGEGRESRGSLGS